MLEKIKNIFLFIITEITAFSIYINREYGIFVRWGKLFGLAIFSIFMCTFIVGSNYIAVVLGLIVFLIAMAVYTYLVKDEEEE
jgi:hypothetical protein